LLEAGKQRETLINVPVERTRFLTYVYFAFAIRYQELEKLGHVASLIRGGGNAKVRTTLMTVAKPCGILILSLILPVAVSTVPARAQDLFGFFRALSQPVAPAPPPQSFEYPPDPFGDQPRRKARPHPKPAPVEEAEVKKPIEPRHPGEMGNPFPALLVDSTLRPGDMVMFPDGLRVFTGQAGSQHRLADFKPLAQAGKALPRETRKLVANLLPSENPAWRTDGLKTGSKLAANTKDIDATGSVKRTGIEKGSRSR
jgi:hypothetical protein